MKTYLIVDGNNLAARAYFAGNRFSFFSMVNAAIHKTEPDNYFLCFDDGTRNSFRHDLYPAYKANRDRVGFEEYDSWIVNLVDVLFKAGLQVSMAPEADDAIASLVKKVDNNKIYILSSDKDMYALIRDDATWVIRPGSLEIVDYDKVIGQLGIYPEQVFDYKALVGDSSDNIPGVTGIGPKTAARLLNEHGTLEGIYSHMDMLPIKVAQKLALQRDKAGISFLLARLDFDTPVRVDTGLAAPKWTSVCNFAIGRLREIFPAEE